MWFKDFLEADAAAPDDAAKGPPGMMGGKIKRPTTVAKKWQKSLPRLSKRMNKSEARAFAAHMADPNANMQVMLGVMTGAAQQGQSIQVYDKPILGNLIKIDDTDLDEFPLAKTLKQATGDVFVPGPDTAPLLGFFHGPAPEELKPGEEDMQGKLVIGVPPLIYQMPDYFAMLGVIWHETRHAYDFAQGVGDMGGPMPADINEYVNMLVEMRAHSEQIVMLLNEVVEQLHVTPQKAILMVKQLVHRGIYALHQESQKVAEKYLDILAKDHSLWQQRPVEEPKQPPIQLPYTPKESFFDVNPPAIVRSAEMRSAKAEQAALILVSWIKAHEARSFFGWFGKKVGIDFYALGKEV